MKSSRIFFIFIISTAFVILSCREYSVADDKEKKAEEAKVPASTLPKGKYKNVLGKETSPYLLQHKNNPVHWASWGKEAFERAKKYDVPVIVSIGYSTCHWCHVMEHEVFEDEEVAEVMNKWYVSIKVDREERPGVDEIYMSSIHAMGQHGGWPLNVIVTPDGKPFFGGTYFPKSNWLQILEGIREVWVKDRKRVDMVSSNLYEHLNKGRQFSTGSVPETIWQDLEKSLISEYDQNHPSWGRAPKFPGSQTLRLILLLKSDTVSEELKMQAVSILTTMQDSGLHDIVGGGFHRYSTDRMWRLPHFEKMLYDNALLVIPYLIAGQQYQRQDLTRTGMRTLDYLLRDMRVTDKNGKFKGYAAAEDADDPGGEGSFYAWSPEQLKEILGQEVSEKLTKQWDIHLGKPTKNHLGHIEPVTSHIPFPRGYSMERAVNTPESIDTRLSWEKYYPKLIEARSKRPRPGLDNKVLTAWNGLALSAFAWGARLTKEEKYYNATVELARVMKDRHTKDGLLRVEEIPAFVNDYGFLLAGFMDAYDATGDPSLVDAAVKIADEAIQKLANPKGGFYATPDNREDLIVRSQILFDNAYPAGNSAMALGLIRLWNITGDKKYREYGQKAIEIIGPVTSQAGRSLGTLLTAYMALQRGHITMVVTGEESKELLAKCRGNTFMAAIIDVDQAKEKDWPILETRKNIKESTALLCIGQVCLKPAKTEEEVEELFVDFSKRLLD